MIDATRAASNRRAPRRRHPRTDRHSGLSVRLLAATQSFGNLAASLVAGMVWTALSPTWAFAYLSVVMLVATTTLIATRLELDPARRFVRQRGK
jgi:hypothetical protein